MTTIAMAAGMVPSRHGAWGIGGEFRAPMAIAVIGGLIVSTLLSLIFVPAMFLMMDDLSRFCVRMTSRFVVRSDEDAAEAQAETPSPHPLPHHAPAGSAAE